MENENIFITISGQAGSGKSRLLFLLKDFLRKEGFSVEFPETLDFVNEADFDNHMVRKFDETIDVIKKNRKIIMKEAQLARKPMGIENSVDNGVKPDFCKYTNYPRLGCQYKIFSVRQCESCSWTF